MMWLLLLMLTGTHALWEMRGPEDYVLVEQPSESHEFPSSLDLTFVHGYSRQLYSVVRNDRVGAHLSEDLARASPVLPDNLVTKDNRKDFAVYQDSERNVNLILHRDTYNKTCDVYGHFLKDGEKYYISPISGSNVQHRIRRASAGRPKRALTGTENFFELVVISDVGLLTNQFQNDETKLARFMRSLVKDFDTVLKSVTTVDVRANIVAVDVGTVSVPWVTDNLINGGTTLDSDGVLTDFATAADLIATVLGITYDHAIGIHGYPMDDQGTEVTYAAEPETICNAGLASVSVVNVAQTFYQKSFGQSILFAAGVTTDGTKRFIMSRKFEFPASGSSNQPWNMRSTKQQELSDVINALTTNCLREFNTGFDFTQIDSVRPMGSRYSLEEQCQNAFGTSVCNTGTTTICYEGITCENPDTGACDEPLFIGDKSQCDTDMFCSYGSCSLTKTTTSTTTGIPTSSSTLPQSSTTEAPPTECTDIQKDRHVVEFEKPTCNGRPVSGVTRSG